MYIHERALTFCMAVEGMPAEEIEEFRGRLAHRMLHEFEHEGYDKKVMKTQKTLRYILKSSQNFTTLYSKIS
jgi:hypothetical protein